MDFVKLEALGWEIDIPTGTLTYSVVTKVGNFTHEVGHSTSFHSMECSVLSEEQMTKYVIEELTNKMKQELNTDKIMERFKESVGVDLLNTKGGNTHG